MGGVSFQRNIGAYLTDGVVAVDQVASFTAGAGGDNSAKTGNIVDRLAAGMDGLSCKVLIGYKTTLSSAETLSFTVTVQHGDNSGLSDAATYKSVAATAVKTGAATAFRGVYAIDVDLSSAKRYVRFNTTGDLSASGTDTAEYCVLAVFASKEHPTAV